MDGSSPLLVQNDGPANNLLDYGSYLEELPREILEQDISHILQGGPECGTYPADSGAANIQTQLPLPSFMAPEVPVQQPGPAKGSSIEGLQSYISSCGVLCVSIAILVDLKIMCSTAELHLIKVFLPVDGKRKKCYGSRPEVARAMGLVPKGADAMKQVIYRKARLRSAGRYKPTKGGALKPALHPNQVVCQDSTRACIEEMLQKDRDLEAARNELHAMRGTLESSAAELAAAEAAKGQLESEVQQKDSDLQVAWSQLHAMENKLEACSATKGQFENQVRNLQSKLAEKADQLAESQRERMEMLDLEDLHSQLAELRQDVDRLEQGMTFMVEELEEARAQNVQLQAELKDQSPAQRTAQDELSDLLASVFKVITAVKKTPHLESMLLHALGK
ncbi:hypothetical protein COCOBI_11-2320 [Coccomyxa sp. Obi]|nr:hypothetical protein COCOBI_11-2320 [Coccomyxa sp. Obi]